LLLTINISVLGLHSLLEHTDPRYAEIRLPVGVRHHFLQHFEALTTYMYSETWERLMDFIRSGLDIGPYDVRKC